MNVNIRTSSQGEETAIEKWRKGGGMDKEDLLILVLSLAVLLVVVLFALSGLQAAQAPGGERGRGPMRMGPEQRLAWLTKQLNLTDEQQAKVKPILEDEHKQMMALHEDSSMSRDQKHAKFREIHQNAFNQIRPLLTDEQQKTLADLQEKQRERMKARHGRRENGAEPESQ
jgi:Spy/CpxP family protein refolding chaperone